VSEGAGESPGRCVGDRIILGGVIVGVASLMVRFSGIVYSWILIRVFKDDAFRDAHFFAFGIVVIVFNIVQQSVAPAFLPVFMGELNGGDRRSAWRFASAVLAGVLGVTGLAAGLAFAFPGVWASLSTLLTGKEAPEAAGLLAAQVPLMAPAFVGISASVVTYMILNAHKRFFWAQAAEGVMRSIAIVAILYCAALKLVGVSAARMLAVGISVGCFARVATHLVAMGRKAFSFRAPAFTSAASRRFLWLMVPLLIGIVFAQVRDLVNHFAVLFHMPGLVTANSLGRRLFTGMGNLVPWALGVAMFPYFCDLVDREDLDELGGILTRSGRVLALAFFAFAGAVAVMSKPFMYALFGSTGEMTPESLSLAALANTCYIIVLPAYAIEKLVMTGFFANRKMLAPIVLGIVFSFLSIGVSVVGIRTFGLTGGAALATVALGYTFSRYLKTVSLIAALKRHVPMFPARQSLLFFLRALIVAAVCAGSAGLVRALYESRWPLEAALAKGTKVMLARVAPEIMLAGAVSMAAGLGAIKLLRMEELAWVIDWFRRKRSGTGRSEDAPGAPG